MPTSCAQPLCVGTRAEVCKIGSSGEQRDCTGSVGAHAVYAAEEEAAELEPAPSERYSRY